MDLFGEQGAGGRDNRPPATPKKVYDLLWRLGPWGADEAELHDALRCDPTSLARVLTDLERRGRIWESKRNGKRVLIARSA